MQVQVKTADSSLTVAAEASWTVLQFKEAIGKENGVDASKMKLTVGGKIMKDAKTMGDYPAAGSQPVNLVVAEGAAPAKAAGGNKSSERMQIENLINEVIVMVKKNKEAQALADKYGDKVPDTTDLQAALGVDGAESVKQRVLDELTKVLGGDWSPFEAYHKPLQKFAVENFLEGNAPTPETREAWIEKAASMGLERFKQYPEVQQVIEKEMKPGKDLVAAALPDAKRIARRAMDLFLDGPDAQFAGHDTLSAQLRLLVVTAVGAMLDTIIDALQDGRPRCQQLMAQICGSVIEKMAEKFPEYSTLFAFAGPMAMNQVMAWHQEYVDTIKGKSF